MVEFELFLCDLTDMDTEYHQVANRIDLLLFLHHYFSVIFMRHGFLV